MTLIRKMVALVLALALLLGGAALAEAQDDSLNAIKNKGNLVLGFDASFPPMGYVDDDGNYVGFDLDVAKEVCARLGVELVLQPIDWSAKDMELNAKNIDCIWNGMTITPEREETMALSYPYLENAQVIVVMADSSYQTAADLAGKTAAVQAGSSGAEALEAAEAFKASLGQVVEWPEYTTCLMDLSNGTVDCVVVDVIVANYYIAKMGQNYRILDESLAPELYAIGFRKEDVALRDAANETLAAMAGDGALAEIATEWFGEDITVVGNAAAAK